MFDRLITVKNVGPSTAIAILSGASPRDLATLIAREDVTGLTRIKGIGKKTFVRLRPLLALSGPTTLAARPGRN